MPRVVVFDTNILFSAIGWQGTPFECIELSRAGFVDAVTCAELLDELSEKLTNKLGFSSEQAADAIVDLLTHLRVVAISGQLRAVVADPDDDKTVECAVVAGASHIVTGDRRHLIPMKRFQGIEIVTAAQFLVSIAAEK